MKNKVRIGLLALVGAIALPLLISCSKPAAEKPAKQEPASLTAAREEAGRQAEQLRQQIAEQEKKMALMEQQLKNEKENARLREELDRKKAEVAAMKKQAAEKAKQATQPPATEPPAGSAGQTSDGQTAGAGTTAGSGQTPAGGNATTATNTGSPDQGGSKPPTEEERAPKKAKTIVIPQGTELVGRLQGTLSSKVNRPGDTFELYLEQPIAVEGETILPVNTRLVGKVIESVISGKMKGKAQMVLMLDAAEINGKLTPITTNTLSFVAESSTKRDAAIIGGGAAVGAIIGAIAGGKKGAVIGAAAGGGAGTTGVLVTRGKEVEFAPETKFNFQLNQDLTLTQKQ